MTDKEITDYGRRYGVTVLRDLKEKNATPGEMLGVMAFAASGIIKYTVKQGKPKEEALKAFNQMLNIWLED